MKNKLLSCAIIIVFAVCPIFAESVKTDNLAIQEYAGMTGRWVRVSSMKDLKIQLERFGSTIELVKKANKPFSLNRYIFIPFSAEKIASLEQAPGAKTESMSSESGFIWPIQTVDRVSSAFGMRNGQLHGAIDLPATKGTPILAAMDGRVLYAQYDRSYGKIITLEHRDNYYTRYSHNSEVFVKKGDCVRKGQIIGYVGSTGHSTGNHLHFEIRFKDIPLNPMDFLPENNNLPQPHGINRNWKR